MRLGELLVQLGLVSPEQVDAALRTQDFFGGRLGTHLVEAKLIGTDQLADALARQLGVPAALERHFSRADPTIVNRLKPAVAARYMAIPILAAGGSSKKVVVAMATPLDVEAVDELSFALGAPIEPLVAGELVIARNLKRLYGVEVNVKSRKALTMHLQTLPAEGPPVRGKPRIPPAPPDPMMAGTHVPAPGARPAATVRAPAPSAAQRFTGSRPVVASPPGARRPTTASHPVASAPPAARPAAVLSLEETLSRISAAEHREQIAEILLEHMAGYFGCGLVFLVRDGSARVWRGFAPGIQTAAIETIAFPIDMPSCFQIAFERGGPFRGPAPAEGMALQRKIWKYLRTGEPAEVIVVPITVKERVLNLVYAHASDCGRLPDGPATDLQAVCVAASSAFVRLIQKIRDEGPAPNAVPR